MGIILVVIGAVIGYGLPHSSQQVIVQGVSSAGVTTVTAKYYSVTMAPATAAATSTSLLNTDGTDRMIQDLTTGCTSVGTSLTFLTGAGLLSNGFNVKAATTTTSANGLQGNTSNIFSNIISTSTPSQFVSSSTVPFPTDVTRIWPTGTYLTFLFSATNTAACTVGVHTITL